MNAVEEPQKVGKEEDGVRKSKETGTIIAEIDLMSDGDGEEESDVG